MRRSDVGFYYFVLVRLTYKLSRVSAYLMQRIPEICDIEVEDPNQLDDTDAQPPPLNI